MPQAQAHPVPMPMPMPLPLPQKCKNTHRHRERCACSTRRASKAAARPGSLRLCLCISWIHNSLLLALNVLSTEKRSLSHNTSSVGQSWIVLGQFQSFPSPSGVQRQWNLAAIPRGTKDLCAVVFLCLPYTYTYTFSFILCLSVLKFVIKVDTHFNDCNATIGFWTEWWN